MTFKSIFFEKPPDDFKCQAEASIGWIHHGDDCLFLQQSAHHPVHAHKWGSPGGKLDSNETPVNAFLREVFEETSIKLNGEKILDLGPIHLRQPHGDFILHLFSCTMGYKPKVTLRPQEHQDYCWIPLVKMSTLDMMSGSEDLAVIYEQRLALIKQAS